MEDNKEVLEKGQKNIEKEVEDDEMDDDEFLKSLEKLDDEIEEEIKEEKRQKNKDAEEARKRREAEAKKKEEQKIEEKKVEEQLEETLTPEQQKENDKKAIQNQVVELKKKYPDIDLKTLGEDQAFQTFLKSSKWGKNSKSMSELYEAYIEVSSTIQKTEKEEVKSRYTKSTPSISSKGGSATNIGDIYSKEDMESIAKKMPTMTDKQYEAIQEKYNKSRAYYKDKK